MTKEKIHTFTQRLPASLHKFARDEAYRQRISLNEYITSLIKVDATFKGEQSSGHIEIWERIKADWEIMTKHSVERPRSLGDWEFEDQIIEWLEEKIEEESERLRKEINRQADQNIEEGRQKIAELQQQIAKAKQKAQKK